MPCMDVLALRRKARVERPRQPGCLFAPCVPPFRLTSGGLEVAMQWSTVWLDGQRIWATVLEVFQ